MRTDASIDIPAYLDLGELILALEAEDPTRILPIGFNNPHSFRGDYVDLAFEPAVDVSIGDMLAAARAALGSTYQGWKGGDYTMAEHTTCWISYEGESSDNCIGPLMLRLLLGQVTANRDTAGASS